MNWSEAKARIESLSFSAEANLASGLRAFNRVLEEEEATRVLRLGVRDDPLHLIEAVRRVHELAEDAIDPRYENRGDVALAAYLSSQNNHPRIINELLTLKQRVRFGKIAWLHLKNSLN